MKIWREADVYTGAWVRDTAGEYGKGQVTRVHSYGCDVDWQSGNSHFLGFAWLDTILSPVEVQQASGEEVFTISDSGDVLFDR